MDVERSTVIILHLMHVTLKGVVKLAGFSQSLFVSATYKLYMNMLLQVGSSLTDHLK